jgi:hypothetical protein
MKTIKELQDELSAALLNIAHSNFLGATNDTFDGDGIGFLSLSQALALRVGARICRRLWRVPVPSPRPLGSTNVGEAGDPSIGLVRRPTRSAVDSNAVQIQREPPP